MEEKATRRFGTPLNAQFTLEIYTRLRKTWTRMHGIRTSSVKSVPMMGFCGLCRREGSAADCVPQRYRQSYLKMLRLSRVSDSPFKVVSTPSQGDKCCSSTGLAEYMYHFLHLLWGNTLCFHCGFYGCVFSIEAVRSNTYTRALVGTTTK